LLDKIKTNNTKDESNELEKITNIFIANVTKNLNNFSYNKIVANFHELYSSLIKELKNNYSKLTLIENYSKILVVMSPIIPHFSNECLSAFTKENDLNWPKIKEEFLIEDKINYVVQINGKKRGVITSKRDITEKELLELVYNNTILKKYTENINIKKKIFIPNRLLNIII